MAALSTQDFLEIKEIKDGTLVLKNNSLRGVLMVSSLNFALKSSDEQEAIIYRFQDFLNSLDFSTQILVQSKKLNITGYLDKLEDLEKKQTNELLKLQTAEYRKFISGIIGEGTIMSKSFYVVVPYSILEAKKVAITKKLKETAASALGEEEFQRCKNQLWQRMEFLGLGLRRCGLTAIPLTTPELTELLWSLYHPKEAEVGYYPEMPPEII
jgi:type IV secretory pathway VirB4 component